MSCGTGSQRTCADERCKIRPHNGHTTYACQSSGGQVLWVLENADEALGNGRLIGRVDMGQPSTQFTYGWADMATPRVLAARLIEERRSSVLCPGGCAGKIKSSAFAEEMPVGEEDCTGRSTRPAVHGCRAEPLWAEAVVCEKRTSGSAFKGRI
jgi:hypothetical protein